MENGFILDVCWGKQEAEPSVGGYKETAAEAGGQGAGVCGWHPAFPVTAPRSFSSPQHPVPAHCPPAAGCVVFQPAALLTNTSAFCLSHSYFTLFPEL